MDQIDTNITNKAAETPAKVVVEQLPAPGKTADKANTVAMVIGILNGLDMLLGYAGIIPPGTIPAVANGVIQIFAGVTQWWAQQKTMKIAFFTNSRL